MSRFALWFVIVLMSATPCRAQTPKLFQERSFSCATLAEAVNHYVALGEEETVKDLIALGSDVKYGFSINERVGWLCRVLFEPKDVGPLRPPAFGGLSLPFNTMPLVRWPLYPVAHSGSTYFVLSQGYTVLGVPESLKRYITYCRKNGVFRTMAIPVPTREQALKDAALLRQSAAWRAIKWRDHGLGFRYFISEDWVWKSIQDQAEAINP